MPWRGIVVALIVVTVCLTVSGFVVDFLIDWLWFSAVGYFDVFWTIFSTRALLFLVAFTASAGVLGLNGWIATGSRKRGAGRSLQVAIVHPALPSNFPLAALPFVVVGASVVLGGLVASVELTNWDVLLRYEYQIPYGERDPIYGKDFSFYLFSLPAYVALKNWMLITISASCLLAAAVYWARGEVAFDAKSWSVSNAAIVHGSALLGLFFAIEVWSYGLDRYLLLYGDNGVVVGASYTDIHVMRHVLWLLMAFAAIAAAVAWANLWVRSYKLPLAAALLVFGGSFALGELFPALFERFYVRPNELQLESPFIGHNVVLTRQAYGLHRVVAKTFSPKQDLTAEVLRANQATIDNIRLWDWQPSMDTFRQLQEIRTYYKFHDVDVDRYWIEGKYRQVMLSARELRSGLLPPNAQTWVNRHVLFTHGIGAVMSPVTQKTAEGLPAFYLQDIPPVAFGGPGIREPRIYYGELTDTYVIVNGTTPEFDYPRGKDNVYQSYGGTGGVPIGGIARRALVAWYFNDPYLMLSDYVTDASRILFRRSISERVQLIAPFLRLDSDPYLVIGDGRLFWVQDAYTTSDYFPYAYTFVPRLAGAELNYIRNSVKIIVDAYNGSVDFYLVDPSETIAATYARAFPGLLKPLSAMSPDLQRHIRYPQDLFFIQAQVYRAYHMETPQVFYNREDLWQFPRQSGEANGATMAPYYTILRLPGEPDAEFILMLPMAPSQRENMIAWLAARCDPPHYGELIVYEFPKDKLVFGPFQIEARINQNTSISQQLSLWNQMGSRVIRGNLHVIPIENSILYVSPLYLRAESGQIPELKRVIAAYGDQVVMEETLTQALATLFAGSVPASPHLETQAGGAHAPEEADRAREALDAYSRAMEKLKAGDWRGFGAELDRLRMVLENLSERRNDR